MKNVKFFLTVTTFCLAVAAVAATKANSKVIEPGYKLNTSTGTCTLAGGSDCNGTGNTCKSGGVQLFRLNSGGGCITPLAKI